MSESILLVDDEAGIRKVLGITLTDMGYDVHTAESGEDAIQIFNKFQPPIIITDIKMPGMDGIELLGKIKTVNPDTEVIMITGHGDIDLAIKSLKSEATDFITKPIKDESLEIALKRARERINNRHQIRTYTANLEELVNERSQLQDRLASLGLMISSISHGIKGLLTGLDGGVYLMESGLKQQDTNKCLEGLAIAKQITERIKKIILNVLLYAKERELTFETVNAVDFAEHVATVVKSKMETSGVQFVCRFDSGNINIQVDTNLLESALVNILENAVDACVMDQAQKRKTVRFTLNKTADTFDFIIRDNGIGMTEADRQRIFTLFYSSKAEKGTGLGLFVADQIVRQHNGTILVETQPGEGAVFTIRLPLLIKMGR